MPSTLPAPEISPRRETLPTQEAAPLVESRPTIERQKTPPPLTVPASPVATTPSLAPSTPLPSPSVASDDDVIEKEWINMAKKVLSLTKGDPFQKGHQISKLQADYLEKRYGKQVKVPEDV